MFSLKSIFYCSYNSMGQLSRFDLNNNNLLSLLLFFTVFRLRNKNSWINLYNRDLQTTIIRHARMIKFFLKSHCLHCLVFYITAKQSSEWNNETWRRMLFSSRNLYKCKQVAGSVLLPFYLFIRFSYTSLCCCLFTSFSHFCFVLMLLL